MAVETAPKSPKLIVDVGLLAKRQVLLVKYKDMPDGQQGWMLPSQLINHLEHPEDAARRVMKEDLGVQAPEIKLNHIESFKGRDGSWHLVFHYKAEFDALPELQPGIDVEIAKWFTWSVLPPHAEVAHHGWALKTIMQLV